MPVIQILKFSGLLHREPIKTPVHMLPDFFSQRCPHSGTQDDLQAQEKLPGFCLPEQQVNH